ncbi:hypothetical protein SAMN05421770_10569 [Granulicella rosea]|uniref:OmpA family protein n=1 Tax=Granulicella rosea TaxID=474952 RepID=A0A239KML1_9BACT|nr:hypothetical protein [Granulicella rosea]SNT19305.1 hypothetical protein SAMN05421770_10569 [Granulicella rosea]
MTSRLASILRLSLRTASALLLLPALMSQISLGQATAAASGGTTTSRAELFGGVSTYRPFNSDIDERPYHAIGIGGVASATAYFNRYLGFQVEGSIFPKGNDDNDCVYTAQAGPVARLQKGRFVPFIHILGGSAKEGGPVAQPCSVWGWGLTGGIGLDYVLPIFHDHLAFRPIQGDFTYNHINNGVDNPATATGGIGEIYAYRISSGFVLRVGNMSPSEATTLTCSASPSEVYPGDPVTLSANALNLGNAKNLQYRWSSSTVKIAGTDATETVDTAGIEPGQYSVAAKLVQGKKERLLASCMADFKVLDTEPPVVTCAADRAAINSGDPVVITTTARSPQNLGLTYSYSTSNGQITGNGATASLTTAGVTPGAITVTCNVLDAKGKTGTATTSVVVATPAPPPPAPAARSLCAVSFERDRKRPVRVDNEAKACLDDIALNLARETGSKLLVIGNHEPKEPANSAAARALNVGDYLTKEKGIDPSRLDLRVGDAGTRSVTNTIVPAGATLDPGTAASFDGSTVKRHGQPYGKARVVAPVHHKAVAKHHKKKVKAKDLPVIQ